VKTIATYNIKGGVGKTATAVNLAYEVARQGWKTLILIRRVRPVFSFASSQRSRVVVRD